ncbi:hypothetical protein FACS189413_18720 [Bacteroidia bacterium]|nr:hypothetical protein FACS189413_18720 [Bacteroidia bacterium]
MEGPKYVPGTLNYQLTDTIIDGHNAKNLQVTYQLTDNIGIAKQYCAIHRDGAAHSTEAYGTYNPETQTATIDLFISEYQPSGYYWVVSVIIADSAGNGQYTYFTDSRITGKNMCLCEKAHSANIFVAVCVSAR